MSNGIEAITAAMSFDMARLNAVSRNLANVGTTGYRAEVLVNSFAPLLSEWTGASGVLESQHDARPGALQQTNRSLDLAITGPGFFEVSTPEGPRYTRRGDFRLDEAGLLTTGEGFAVLGDGGEIHLPNDEVRFDRDGSIRSRDQVIGRLSTVEFLDTSNLELRYEGNALYRAGAEAASTRGGSAIHQGRLEASNVQPLAEIIGMMDATRHFGASAQALRAYDQMLGLAISELGAGN